MKKKHSSFPFGTLSKLASALITLVVFAGIIYLYISSSLPDVTALKSARLQVPLKIYASDGQLIGEFGEMQRTTLTLDQIPPQLINAVLATEDQRFYEHGGVDMYGLLRATGELILTGLRLVAECRANHKAAAQSQCKSRVIFISADKKLLAEN